MRFVFINVRDATQQIPLRRPDDLLRLCTIADSHGHEAGILDLNAARSQFGHPQAFKNEIKEEGWDSTTAVIFACHQGQYAQLKELLPIWKEVRPDPQVIFAGGLITAMPKTIMDLLRQADAGMVGEQEGTFEEVMKAVESSLKYSEISGLVYRDFATKEIKMTRPRPLITDLDNKIPDPYLSILPRQDFEAYFMGSPLNITQETLQARRRIEILGQRGTLLPNSYSEGHSRSDLIHIWGETAMREMEAVFGEQPEVRYFSPFYMVRRIIWWRVKHMVDMLTINDANFMTDRQRLVEFCKTYADAELHDSLKWGCYGDPKTLDTALLRKMADAGCHYVIYNMHSQSGETLKKWGYGQTLEASHNLLEIHRQVNKPLLMSFTIGFPGEHIDDFLETFEFCMRNKAPCDPSIYVPTPGTSTFHEHLECCLQSRFTGYPVEYEKALHYYIDDFCHGRITITNNHTYSIPLLLVVKHYMQTGDLHGLLRFSHDIKDFHSEKWKIYCPACSGDMVWEKTL